MIPKVSIVIPVYKTEKYIDECIASVLRQDYGNLEIILVDDGSPDNCPQICDEYAKKYNNIIVVHKANSGLGLSRNAGVDACSGDYVFFVDSDDKMDGEHAISYLVESAVKTKADLVVGCYRRFNDEGWISEINNHHLINGEDTSNPDFRFRGFYQYGHLSYDWGKLYRKSFMIENRIKRGSYPFTQDKAFNMRFYACNPQYAFIDESVCCYRVNESSVTYKYKENYIPVWISIASNFSRFMKKRNIKKEIEDLPAFHIFFGSFFLAKQELQAGNGLFKTSKKIKEYAKSDYVKNSMRKIIGCNFTKGIKTMSWRWMIWGSTLLFNLHMYFAFALGISILRKLSIDERITRKRYSGKN